MVLKDKVGTRGTNPLSITAGVGLVRQENKYGRVIAGLQLRNYTRLSQQDFAYNKSATKAFPQGYVALNEVEENGSVPSSMFICFRADSDLVSPGYLKQLFVKNLHGKWLKQSVSVGARTHGSLNVVDDDLMSLPVPLPASLQEQTSIALLLGGTDTLLSHQDFKLSTLRNHKAALLQQFFPTLDESGGWDA